MNPRITYPIIPLTTIPDTSLTPTPRTTYGKEQPFSRTYVLPFLEKAVAVVDDLALARYLIALVRGAGAVERLLQDPDDRGAVLLIEVASIAHVQRARDTTIKPAR